MSQLRFSLLSTTSLIRSLEREDNRFIIIIDKLIFVSTTQSYNDVKVEKLVQNKANKPT